MDLEVEKYPNVTVVTLPGKTIEASSAAELKRAILPIVETNTNVIFDMSRTRFIDSMGCSVLVFTARKLKEKGGSFNICCVSAQVAALFDMMGFRNFLTIFSSRKEAVQAFR